MTSLSRITYRRRRNVRRTRKTRTRKGKMRKLLKMTYKFQFMRVKGRRLRMTSKVFS